jgi:hypothetical protein
MGKTGSVSYSHLDLLLGLAASLVLPFSRATNFACRSIARLSFTVIFYQSPFVQLR